LWLETAFGFDFFALAADQKDLSIDDFNFCNHVVAAAVL
jgi:hypothetical protein